jgi:urease accessory protein UreF
VSRLLLPFELPAVHEAFLCARVNAARELIAYDQALRSPLMAEEFLTASRAVGRAQLLNLRSLKDERLVQRYLHAVQRGEAHGWHSVVYGVVLSLYSLPLRQGLAGYARHTLRGFVRAAPFLRLKEAQANELVEELCADVPDTIEAVISSGGKCHLMVCA